MRHILSAMRTALAVIVSDVGSADWTQKTESSQTRFLSVDFSRLFLQSLGP